MWWPFSLLFKREEVAQERPDIRSISKARVSSPEIRLSILDEDSELVAKEQHQKTIRLLQERVSLSEISSELEELQKRAKELADSMGEELHDED